MKNGLNTIVIWSEQLAQILRYLHCCFWRKQYKMASIGNAHFKTFTCTKWSGSKGRERERNGKSVIEFQLPSCCFSLWTRAIIKANFIEYKYTHTNNLRVELHAMENKHSFEFDILSFHLSGLSSRGERERRQTLSLCVCWNCCGTL